MGRLADWEQRLSQFVEANRNTPYHDEKWNCCLFARACVEALTGQLLPVVWHGSVEKTADANLERIDPRQASRGDLIVARLPKGETIGVCLGLKSAFVGEDGLTFVRTTRWAIAAWRVG